MAEYLIYLWIFCLGLVIGSFLNVLIYRIPRKLNFALGRSFCPSCRQKISFYDNIPVASYFILRGRCRKCKARISFRYPLVEIISGCALLFLFRNHGLTTGFFVYSFLSAILIAIFFIDLDFQIIPDLLTLPGMVIGLAISMAPHGMGIISSLVGLLVGGGALYMIALLGDWLFKKESMGGGDIKMAAMLGAFLGWQKIIVVFFGSALIGLLISLIVMAFSSRVRANHVIPFGPFLAMAAFVAAVYGDEIIAFYLNRFLRM